MRSDLTSTPSNAARQEAERLIALAVQLLDHDDQIAIDHLGLALDALHHVSRKQRAHIDS